MVWLTQDFPPAVIDMCSQDNGGCARHAQCSQTGVNVSCACAPGYSGDGYICEPIDRCADGRNGDCSEHALCISTGPVSVTPGPGTSAQLGARDSHGTASPLLQYPAPPVSALRCRAHPAGGHHQAGAVLL